MLRVALTGGVGSGKSAAATMLAEMGAHLSQSDEVGRALMVPGAPAFHAIVARFGPAVVLADGSLDRSALARIAFDEGRVEELNAIVHPLVLAAQAEWAAEVASRDPAGVAVMESALVFETKLPWRERFDRIVVVTAPVEVRRRRFLARSLTPDDFERRAAAQWTEERKASLADFVLVNDGSLDELHAKVAGLWASLKAESLDRVALGM